MLWHTWRIRSMAHETTVVGHGGGISKGVVLVEKGFIRLAKGKKAFLCINSRLVEFVPDGHRLLYNWMLSVLEKLHDRFTSNCTSS